MSDRAEEGRAVMVQLMTAMREVAASNRALVNQQAQLAAQQAHLGAQMSQLSDRMDALAAAIESSGEEAFQAASPSLGVNLGRAVLQGMLGSRPYVPPPAFDPPPPAFGRPVRR